MAETPPGAVVVERRRCESAGIIELERRWGVRVTRAMTRERELKVEMF